MLSVRDVYLVGEKVALAQFFSECFCLPLSALFYQCICSSWTNFKSEFKTEKIYAYIQKWLVLEFNMKVTFNSKYRNYLIMYVQYNRDNVLKIRVPNLVTDKF
jgi:hypothetical protein